MHHRDLYHTHIYTLHINNHKHIYASYINGNTNKLIVNEILCGNKNVCLNNIVLYFYIT